MFCGRCIGTEQRHSIHLQDINKYRILTKALYWHNAGIGLIFLCKKIFRTEHRKRLERAEKRADLELVITIASFFPTPVNRIPN